VIVDVERKEKARERQLIDKEEDWLEIGKNGIGLPHSTTSRT
jgi:hypothetical protein